jgi:general secretion pathway protein A
MYKQFFGLRDNPFNVNPDPRYLFLTSQTQEALDEMTYGIHARKGLILLTGEVGTGKTTLINRLLDWLRQQQTPTCYIFNSHLDSRHLFDFILADFGVPFEPKSNGSALMRLNQWLIERYRAGETPVLIVDEAQGMPTHVLEEIRMLLNLETPHDKLLQIVLAGQPELEDRLRQPDLRQLKQRITLRCKTAPLTLDETRDYIHARLHIAGANGTPIFAPQAMDAVHFYSRGIPRVVNLLCEHGLINSYVDDVKPVPAHIIDEIAREFQFDDIKPFAPATEFVGAFSTAPPDTQSAMECAIPMPVDWSEIITEEQIPAPLTGVPGPYPNPEIMQGQIHESDVLIAAHKSVLVIEEPKEDFDLPVVPDPVQSVDLPAGVGSHEPAAIAFSCDSGTQCAAPFAAERTRLASPALLQLVEAKPKFKEPQAPAQRPAHVPQKPAHAMTSVNTIKSTLIRHERMAPRFPRFSWTRRIAKWKEDFSSAITSVPRTRIRASLLVPCRESIHSMLVACRGWLSKQGSSPGFAAMRDGLKKKASLPISSLSRWLRQPWAPVKRKLPNAALFTARRGLSHQRKPLA